jgi:hypothetical protein
LATRLPLAILVASLALLAGAAPAWGCAAEMPRGDCCPENPSAPCQGGATDPISGDLSNACCATVPPQAAATPPAVARVDPAALLRDGSANPPPPAAIAAAEVRAAPRPARLFDRTAASGHDAAPIFLRTGRLRL